MNRLPTIEDIKQFFVPRATQALLFILVALIPFSIRYVFDSPSAFQTGAYSDFTSFSIYLSDLVLLALLSIIAMFHMKHPLPKIWLYSALGAVLWLIIEVFLQQSNLLTLQIYFSSRFISLILFAGAVSQISVSREKIAWIFAILGVFQSLIAIIQFYNQKSLGLYYFGESHLNPDILGVAKIVAHGTKLIRGYGTFPHPNLLAAFLVASILFNLYLITKTTQISRGVWLYLLLGVQIFGLFVTLSRGGFVALIVGLAISIGFSLARKRYDVVKQIIFPTILAVAISVSILAPYLNTRATLTDSATKERLFYTNIGKVMIYENAIIGVGPGNSVLHMKHYSGSELEPWEVQPVHNYWVISWAEWGVGAIVLFILIIFPIFALFKSKLDTWNTILASVCVSFLALFFIDHYFYTIWSTQLLLWLFIGLILREIIYDKLSRLK